MENASIDFSEREAPTTDQVIFSQSFVEIEGRYTDERHGAGQNSIEANIHKYLANKGKPLMQFYIRGRVFLSQLHR